MNNKTESQSSLRHWVKQGQPFTPFTVIQGSQRLHQFSFKWEELVAGRGIEQKKTEHCELVLARIAIVFH